MDDEVSFSDQLPDLQSYGPDDDSSDSDNEEEMEDLYSFTRKRAHTTIRKIAKCEPDNERKPMKAEEAGNLPEQLKSPNSSLQKVSRQS